MFKPTLSSRHSAFAIIIAEVAILGFQLVASFILALCGVGELDSYFWSILATQIGILLSAFATLSLSRRDVPCSVLDYKPRFVRPAQVGRLIAIAVGLLFLSLPITSAFTLFITKLGLSMPSSPTDFGTPVEFLLGLALVCIMPAICEEFLVRGTVLNGLVKLGTFPAIFLSAFLFAILHGNPFQLVHQFLLGAVMAYVVLVSGNILSSVIIHFTNNFLALAFSALASVMFSSSSELPTVESLAFSPLEIFTLVFFAILGAVLFGWAIFTWTRASILETVKRHPEKRETYLRWRDAGGFFKYTSHLVRWNLGVDGEREKLSPVMILAILVSLFILGLNTYTLAVM